MPPLQTHQLGQVFHCANHHFHNPPDTRFTIPIQIVLILIIDYHPFQKYPISKMFKIMERPNNWSSLLSRCPVWWQREKMSWQKIVQLGDRDNCWKAQTGHLCPPPPPPPQHHHQELYFHQHYWRYSQRSKLFSVLILGQDCLSNVCCPIFRPSCFTSSLYSIFSISQIA